MIKVTQKGKVRIQETKYIFTCDKCFTEWEATRESISVEQDKLNPLEVLYVCKCPGCKRTIYTGKKIESNINEQI